MSISADQYQGLLARLTALENTYNNVAVAMQKFITLTQITEYLTLAETEIASLREEVDALTARVTSIEEEPMT